MPKNRCQNNFNHLCFRMTSFIRHLVLILLFKMDLLKEKINTFLKPLELYCFKCTCPSIFGPRLFPQVVFLINQLPSSVLNWDTPFQTLFPHKSLFTIEPWVFGCTCFVRDVRSHVSKLDPKSLKCIFLGYSRVQKGYRCYCPSFRKYMVFANVTFLESVFFFSRLDPH